MSHLFPISLCNVIFKIITKVLANKLKTILPDIISPSQGAFVVGHLISDNSMLAFSSTATTWSQWFSYLKT